MNLLDRLNAQIERAHRRHVTVFLACALILLAVTCAGF